MQKALRNRLKNSLKQYRRLANMGSLTSPQTEGTLISQPIQRMLQQLHHFLWEAELQNQHSIEAQGFGVMLKPVT